MAGETIITVAGNLTADPELRFTPAGHAVASFTVASTPRTYDKSTKEWRDGDTLFLRCSAWRSLAENIAESLTRGTAVIAVGRLKQRSYETQQGEKRTVVELDVDNLGPSLARATAAVTKTTGDRQQGQQNARPQSGGWGQQQAPQDDPWGQQPSSEPPF
ncbi:single-stranded DNA-binding protein [Streptomyces sp. NBC_01808]|uniref:single-stranded DNA-binding protein n=1 Tax=Streptomyces sp. NBC_01808 TaxID=2975947 RepID=UPI002DD7E054|nr:single-stranded DNA-binding protein [Streptomyces sp. NBC_01808]WSA39493.1 single-stranded DNA-binding protein [Streptomyces sp. NBC_01808]